MKLRWGVAGGLLGGLLALVFFAPASWLAAAVADATGQRLLLADARGTVWHGSAVVVLSAGADSRDASALPGRLQWALAPEGFALVLRAQQACCINGELALRVVPGLTRLRLELPGRNPPGQALGQWPAAWLAGLGTPWNTLQPSGVLQLHSPGLSLEQVQGRWRFDGRAELELQSMASRVSTLPALGSYRLTLRGEATRGGDASLLLATIGGPLQLSGSGQWAGGRFRFRGQASAAPGSEAVLANLLNIVGRRQGAVSLIAIG